MINADRNFYQPREALLKYAQLAEEDPQWTAGMSFLLCAVFFDLGGLGSSAMKHESRAFEICCLCLYMTDG